MLRVEDITIRFGGLTAVNRVGFTVEQGKIVSVIGPNGAGKTTLFNAITGIYQPTEGHIYFEGHRISRALDWRTVLSLLLVGLLTGLGLVVAMNVNSLWEQTVVANYLYQEPFPWSDALRAGWRYLVDQPLWWNVVPLLLGVLLGGGGALTLFLRSRRTPDVVACYGIARTFQNIRLFPNLSVLENVLLGMGPHLKTRGWHAAFRLPLFYRDEAAARRRAGEILELVDLAAAAETQSDELPYGHQRRLEIARALALKPKLLLLDEPAAGMNPAEADRLIDLIRRIRDLGVTIVLIEHHMRVVMGISDQIVVLDYGNKIAQGTPDEIRANPRVIDAYLGKEEVE